MSFTIPLIEPNHSLARVKLRRHLRNARRALSHEQQQQAEQQLAQQLIQSIWFKQLNPTARVALYLSNDGEISPTTFCQYLWQHQIDTFLPLLTGETLAFAHYHSDCDWQKNHFGILEPIDAQPLTGADMDLVLLPLVGFDKSGGRLGMGGGFYDKTFANKVAGHPPILLGLAHECQEVTCLPIESWDVPLDGIITPSHCIACESA